MSASVVRTHYFPSALHQYLTTQIIIDHAFPAVQTVLHVRCTAHRIQSATPPLFELPHPFAPYPNHALRILIYYLMIIPNSSLQNSYFNLLHAPSYETIPSYDIMIKSTASRQSIGGEEVTIMQTLLDLLVAVMAGVITDLIGKWLDGIKKR